MLTDSPSLLCILDPNPPRDSAFREEYNKLSTILHTLSAVPLSLYDPSFGLAEFEVVSPVNLDYAYLSIIRGTCALLFHSVLAEDGDATAYGKMLGAVGETVGVFRLLRSCGKPLNMPAPGIHEVLAPFIDIVSFSSNHPNHYHVTDERLD